MTEWAEGEHIKLGRGLFSKLKSIRPIFLVLGVAILLFLILQVERFISQGTLLGYQVRETKKLNTEQADIVGSNKKLPSVACDKISDDEVKKVIGLDVERVGGFFGDRKSPSFSSLCSYRTTDKKDSALRTVTITLRDSANDSAAKTSLESVKKKSKGEDVKDLGDGAYFTNASSQLTVIKGKQVITVIVSKPTQKSAVESKSAAIGIAKLALE